MRRSMFLSRLSLLTLLSLPLIAHLASAQVVPAPEFSVSFPKERSAVPLDGRVLLLLSTDPSGEPRNQISISYKTQIVFGIDVDQLQPGQAMIVTDTNAFGYPVRSLHDVKPGEYYVQALLHRYETFHRADGHTVKLPMDRGEGQHWNSAPGNLYSKPQKITVSSSTKLSISLDQEIPPIDPPKDTKYIRHLHIQSQLLTKFWGRPMFLSANVLVPEGFDEHPNARFPLMISEDHFNHDFEGLRTEPPDPNLKPDYSERFHISGYNRIQQEEEYKFYQTWISKDFPRYLVAQINHANPYYDDSYAVDSANLGPYGEAIETELIPAIEKQFRAIGQGWARFVYGGSTGGWISLAVQMFYPDHYNGAFVACPDPVDFRAYTNINLYTDTNAFYLQGPNTQMVQPSYRNYLGQTLATTQSVNQYELALGSHARSGEQFDIWQAVYGPVGSNGYPQQIFNKESGEIDHKVAEYWKEHYDLSAILQRDWSKLGPKLQGKLHIYVGSADNYMLNDAVYLLEDFLKTTTNPPYDGEVKYGDKAEHCWNGDPNLPNYLSRLHYNTQYLPKILERMTKTAPPGADLSSWRY
ncbi:MAG TPA: alpha/beta hydrolase-fold protein [Candidatus Dormibacteraeota bacterium]|nr:alpha/beta hydrolase-fold protein [Candidatus Dormibacteraeota bacterium]